MTSSNEGLESVGLIVVLCLLCGVSVIVNVLVLVVLIIFKDMRGVVNILVGNLAVSGVIIAGISLPLQLDQANRELEYTTSGEVACKLVKFLPNFSIMLSILTLVVIAFDRYWNICRQKKLSMRRLAVTLVGVYVLSVAASAPQLYEYSLYYYVELEDGENHTEVACGGYGIPENFETIYASIFVSVSYLLPVILIIVNYSLIARFLWAHSKAPTDGGVALQGAVSKHRTKVAKVLAASAIVFVILWAPYFILFTLEEVTGMDDTAYSDPVVGGMKILFVAISTMSNSAIYSLSNTSFRRAVLRLATCGRYARARVGDTTNTTNAPTAS